MKNIYNVMYVMKKYYSFLPDPQLPMDYEVAGLGDTIK